MSSLSLRLPESLHAKIRELARRDRVSINQFIATAAAEKTATLLTVDYLKERARRGSLRQFDQILDRVPNKPAVSGDELPQTLRRSSPPSAQDRETYRGTPPSKSRTSRRRRSAG